MEPGIYDGLDNEAYHLSPGISKSGLARFSESPARFRWGERVTTRALTLGSLIHCAVLEPEQLEKRYYVTSLTSLNPQHKAYQAEVLKACGAEIVKRSDMDDALYIRDAVMAHPVAQMIITPELIVERSAAWIDQETGVLCRMRADGMNKRHGVVIDAKSTQDAGPAAFARACAEYKYHWQDPFYRAGLKAADNWEPDAFIFLAIEKEKPFLNAAYELTPKATAFGLDEIEFNMRKYARCLAEDHWPGHSEKIEALDLPHYAYRN